MTVSQFSWKPATTYTNGAAIPAGTVLSYSVQVDTVNPPVKKFAVPAAKAVTGPDGLITVSFIDVGFAPINGTAYFADVTEASGANVSDASGIVSFTYTLTPSAPTAFAVG